MPEVPCPHARDLEPLPKVEIKGCETCLKTGGQWVHLRRCLHCGLVGCCDSSPNKHASGHAKSEDHPVVRSAEKGENWVYCFKCDLSWQAS